ncbi:PIF1-like helicase-domain-containing protein [Mycena metata]|uniref:ATP-dependent DNA helicase n=1 Tax=Mycena metata TaxID=1033252 RepID=A0AAD7P384_9AGAR|nr:PIF1-like helicase-domain-containing protein [Mycena metata]
MRRALAKAAQMKFYAVSKGREGPKVYKTWDECKDNVSRFPGAVHRSFSSMEQAETWLASSLSLQASNPSQTVPRSTDFRRSQKPFNQDKRLRLNVPSQIPVAPSSSSNAEASTSSMSLSAEQQAVLERVIRGQSTFFSGSAGTGKSVLLRAIINQLGGSGCPTLGITASTGIASINIGGTTLHSWAGIGIGNEPAKKIGGMLLGQPKCDRVLKRWRTVKTLIIDEISMVDGALFDKLVCVNSICSTRGLTR